VLRLRRYEQISIENPRSCSNGVSLAQNFVHKGSFPNNYSSCRKTDKRSFVWYKNVDTSFFRVVTMYAFNRQIDRQTDGRTDGRTNR